MWIVWVREREVAPDWAGRRWWAALDAIAWPLGWMVFAQGLPPESGALGPLVVAVGVTAAVLRLRRAVLKNDRYWFTTWRWGRILLAGGLMAVVIRVASGG